MFVFSGLKNLLPKFNGIIVDNFVFRLHYRFTVLFLMAFVVLFMVREYFGDPIRCHASNNNIPTKVLDQFCWVQSTFSLPDHWDSKIGEDALYPGIGHHEKGMKRVYHKYYQWVVFMLFIQAVIFYLPRYMWKMAEHGKVRTLLSDLNKPLMEIAEKKEKYQLLARYIVDSMGSNSVYAFSHVSCEMLNFINIVGQIYLTDRFLGYEFSSFGLDVIKHSMQDPEDRTDPMIKVFPRMTKCTLYRFGFGSDIEPNDAICVLPLNIVNEKVFIFLWFWFIALAVISAMAVVYRTVTLISPAVREYLLRLSVRLVPSKTISGIVSNLGFGDWFLLYLLSKNMDPFNFKEFSEVLINERSSRTKPKGVTNGGFQ